MNTQHLTPGTAALLLVPPLMWAGNAVVGRLATDLISPITLNFLRWVVAFFLLLPLAWKLFVSGSSLSALLWANWRRYALLGLLWSGLLSAGEWSLGAGNFQWGWPLALTLAYVSVGPAIIAYRCYGLGVQRVGPTLAAFFTNLTPLIAAVLSAAFLGELPQLYHALAFVLIVGGIWVGSRKA